MENLETEHDIETYKRIVFFSERFYALGSSIWEVNPICLGIDKDYRYWFMRF